MFGPDEMEAGDQVTITVTQRHHHDRQLTEECGISLMYEDDDDGDDANEVDVNVEEDGRMKEEEEDPLNYYKSWNNIIGKDLSAFQSPTGEYILQNKRICWRYISFGFGSETYYEILDPDS
ncbi:hypothetical protein Tco_0029396 [Tanacetum coccineum]